MKDEIKEILEDNDELIVRYKDNSFESFDTLPKNVLDYITNLQEKIEYNDSVLKALHRYFTEHECYEINEFLRQLENCTKNDMIWLRRTAGEEK